MHRFSHKELGREQKIGIVIDDDKHHIEMKIASNNLKNTRYVRDNRQGLTCHAAASTCNNFVLGTQYERLNDTTFSATLILFNDVFSTSGSTADLNHVHVSMDRGYWACKILTFFLSSGAVIWGTVKRVPWFPFTYGQNQIK